MDQVTEKSLFVEGSIIGGRYEVIDSLGSGGMGTVVRVIDRALNNETVALKLLYPHMARDQVSFARFRNEVLIARKLAHPNIVRLYDFGAAGQGYYYISMEYVEGGSLGGRIYGAKELRLNFQQCLEVLYAICQGLACAHSHGVMHRDLKPDNILLTNDSVVKVSDFGLARSTGVERGLTATGDTVGTPYYMAPEQLRGDKLDQRVDIYALGIMAFEMVVGRRPFFHDSYVTLAHMHFRDPIPQIAGPESGIPDWFQEFVERCAAKKKQDRYLTAEEAGRVIADHLHDPGNLEIERRPAVMSFNGTRSTTKRPSVKKRLSFWLLIGFGLLSVMVGLVLLVRSHEGLRSEAARILLRAEKIIGVDTSTFKEMIHRNISESDFFTAVENNQYKIIKDLLATGTDPNRTDSQGRTGLHLAALANNVELAKIFLRAAADPNQGDTEGRSSLSYAAESGGVDLVRTLLEAKADANGVDAKLRTPLAYAALAGNAAVVDLLNGDGINSKRDVERKTPLIHAVINGHPLVVQALIDFGTDLKAPDKLGNTALHYAVKKADEEAIRILVQNGAPLDVPNLALKTPRQVVPTKLRGKISKIIAEAQAVAERQGASTSAELPDTPITSAMRQTTLRTSGGRSYRINGSERNVQQKIYNQGGVVAEDVQVEIVLSNGVSIPLEGPTRLAPNERADYQAPTEETRNQVEAAKLKISCSNCR